MTYSIHENDQNKHLIERELINPLIDVFAKSLQPTRLQHTPFNAELRQLQKKGDGNVR